MKLTYYSDVKDGKLQNNISALIKKEIPFFEGKRVEISIQKLKSTRTVRQNRLWWLYMKIIADELGYDKDTIHEIAKYKFLKRELVNEKTGECFEFVGSSANLSKSEFSDLVERLRRWASESFGIVLPDPGENFAITF